MSRFGKEGCRCDWCGKFTNNRNGEYTKPNGNAGYIHSPDWDKNGSDDVCEECAGLLCPHCGSGGIVSASETPLRVQCKDCGRYWSLQVRQESDETSEVES